MQFRHKNSLVRHLCQHTGERPHPCQICGQAFISTHRLKEHTKKYHPKAAAKQQINDKELLTKNKFPALSNNSTLEKEDIQGISNALHSSKKPKKVKSKKTRKSIVIEDGLTLKQEPAARLLYTSSALSKANLQETIKDSLPKISKPTINSEIDSTIQPTASNQTEIQQPATTALNIPVMSLVQATNGQMFLLTTNPYPPPSQYNPISDASVNTSTPLTMNNSGCITAPSTVQFSPPQPPQYLFQGHLNQPQLFSNVMHQNNLQSVLLGPSSSCPSTVNNGLESSGIVKSNCVLSQNIAITNLPKYEDNMRKHQNENASRVPTQDSQTKQNILLTSYGRQHQQNISKTSQNQANTIITNITTLKSEEQHLLNQEDDVNGVLNIAQQQQQQQQKLTTNSIQHHHHQVMSLESLKQLSTTSSSSSSLLPSINHLHKQIQLSKEEIESQNDLPLSSSNTFISFGNTTRKQQQTIQNDSYLCEGSENERLQEAKQRLQTENPYEISISHSIYKKSVNGNEDRPTVSSTSLEQNKSRRKINCLRSVRRKTNIEHIFSTNTSMPQQPPMQQQNKVMLSGVKEDKEIRWSNYNSSMREGDNNERDIDLIKRIPAQLTNFNRSSSLSHPSSSSMSFSNGYFRTCNITSARGEETLETINFGENEESLRILEKQEEESNNNTIKSGNNSVGDIIKVALVESQVC